MKTSKIAWWKRSARVPFSLVAVIILMFSVASMVYLSGVDHERTRNVISKPAQDIEQLGKDIGLDIAAQAYYIANLEIIENTKDDMFLYDPTFELINSEAQEEFEKYLNEQLDGHKVGTNKNYILTIDNWQYFVLMEQQTTKDVYDRSMFSTPFLGPYNIMLGGIQEVDTRHSADEGITRRTVYFRSVGEVTFTLTNIVSGHSLKKTVVFDKNIYSPLPLLKANYDGYQANAEGDTAELGRLVRYIVQTIAQYRALQGVACGEYGNSPEQDVKDLLSENDVVLAIKLALLLEQARRYRTFDDDFASSLIHFPSITRHLIHSLMYQYTQYGFVDAADLFALYKGLDLINFIDWTGIMGQTIYQFSDKFVYDLLRLFWPARWMDPIISEPFVNWTEFNNMPDNIVYDMLYFWVWRFVEWLGLSHRIEGFSQTAKITKINPWTIVFAGGASPSCGCGNEQTMWGRYGLLSSKNSPTEDPGDWTMDIRPCNIENLVIGRNSDPEKNKYSYSHLPLKRSKYRADPFEIRYTADTSTWEAQSCIPLTFQYYVVYDSLVAKHAKSDTKPYHDTLKDILEAINRSIKHKDANNEDERGLMDMMARSTGMVDMLGFTDLNPKDTKSIIVEGTNWYFDDTLSLGGQLVIFETHAASNRDNWWKNGAYKQSHNDPKNEPYLHAIIQETIDLVYEALWTIEKSASTNWDYNVNAISEFSDVWLPYGEAGIYTAVTALGLAQSNLAEIANVAKRFLKEGENIVTAGEVQLKICDDDTSKLGTIDGEINSNTIINNAARLALIEKEVTDGAIGLDLVGYGASLLAGVQIELDTSTNALYRELGIRWPKEKPNSKSDTFDFRKDALIDAWIRAMETITPRLIYQDKWWNGIKYKFTVPLVFVEIGCAPCGFIPNQAREAELLFPMAAFEEWALFSMGEIDPLKAVSKHVKNCIKSKVDKNLNDLKDKISPLLDKMDDKTGNNHNAKPYTEGYDQADGKFYNFVTDKVGKIVKQDITTLATIWIPYMLCNETRNHILNSADLSNIVYWLSTNTTNLTGTQPTPPSYEFWKGPKNDAEFNKTIMNESCIIKPLTLFGLLGLEVNAKTGNQEGNVTGMHLADAQDDTMFYSLAQAPFETRWNVSAKGKIDLKVTTYRLSVPLMPENSGSHVETYYNYTVKFDFNFPVVVYTSWNLTGVNYTRSRSYWGLMDKDNYYYKGNGFADKIKPFFVSLPIARLNDAIKMTVDWILDEHYKLTDLTCNILDEIMEKDLQLVDAISDTISQTGLLLKQASKDDNYLAYLKTQCQELLKEDGWKGGANGYIKDRFNMSFFAVSNFTMYPNNEDWLNVTIEDMNDFNFSLTYEYVRENPTVVYGDVDLVFVVDTSGSMYDEMQLIYNSIEDVRNELEPEVDLQYTVYLVGAGACSHYGFGNGAGSLPHWYDIGVGVFSGSHFPGYTPSDYYSLDDLFSGNLLTINWDASYFSEMWGPAVTYIANYYGYWRPNSVHIIVPVSDECAFGGNTWRAPNEATQPPDDTPTRDRLAAEEAALACVENNIIAAPFYGDFTTNYVDIGGVAGYSNAYPEVLYEMDILASETGGFKFEFNHDETSFANQIKNLVATYLPAGSNTGNINATGNISFHNFNATVKIGPVNVDIPKYKLEGEYRLERAEKILGLPVSSEEKKFKFTIETNVSKDKPEVEFCGYSDDNANITLPYVGQKYDVNIGVFAKGDDAADIMDAAEDALENNKDKYLHASTEWLITYAKRAFGEMLDSLKESWFTIGPATPSTEDVGVYFDIRLNSTPNQHWNYSIHLKGDESGELFEPFMIWVINNLRTIIYNLGNPELSSTTYGSLPWTPADYAYDANNYAYVYTKVERYSTGAYESGTILDANLAASMSPVYPVIQDYRPGGFFGLDTMHDRMYVVDFGTYVDKNWTMLARIEMLED